MTVARVAGRPGHRTHAAPMRATGRTACGLFEVDAETLPRWQAREATCQRCRQAYNLGPVEQLLLPEVDNPRAAGERR